MGREGTGLLLIAIALLLAYIAVAGKYKCLSDMFLCIQGKDTCNCKSNSLLDDLLNIGATNRSVTPLPSLPIITSFQ